MSRDPDDDLFTQRARAVSILEHDDNAFGALEHDTEGGVFTEDDLEQADWLSRKMGNADSLTQKVALRNQRHADLSSVAPFARSNPPSVLAGTLGGQQSVMAGQQIQVANWGGDDAETTCVTVTLGPVQPINVQIPHAGQLFRPYGIVQFGTRGFMVKAEVDIGAGCQFTVTGSSVTVQVALPLDNTTDPANVTTMKLTGMLSFQQIFRTTPITRTLYLFNDVSPTTNYIIPAFAKELTLWKQLQADDYSIVVRSANGSASQALQVGAGDVMTTPMLLAGEAYSVDVTANGGSNNRGSLIFGLSI